MNIIRYPEKKEWAKIVKRPHLDVSKLNETVASVLADVKKRGDDAVKGYELKFDHVDLPTLAVSDAEMEEAERLVDSELKAAIQLAHHLLAEECRHRKGGSLYSRRYCPTLLYCSHAGYACQDCRMQRDCTLHTSDS